MEFNSPEANISCKHEKSVGAGEPKYVVYTHKLKLDCTPPLWLRTQPTDSRICIDDLPTHWATEEERMAYRDNTGGETMKEELHSTAFVIEETNIKV